METKSFQIVMNDRAHDQLKRRAKLMGMNIGDFAEHLLSSLEFRIKKAYEIAAVDPARHDLDDQFIKTILLADKAGLTEEELNRDLKDIGQTTRDTEWTPNVRL